MTPPRAPHALAGAMLLALCGCLLLLSSCGTIERTVVAPPHIEGASFVGNKTCFECHTNISRSFAMSRHAQIQVIAGKGGDLHGCESCHGPGSLHVAGGGGRGKFIVNPGNKPEACYECHLQVRTEFNLPQHHPLPEGRMNCVQCHDPHGLDIMKPATSGLAMARVNESCATCHREQTRPHVFEHEAMREGCTVCHSPHGSINAKMLVERDSNLCLKCHAQIPVPGTAGLKIFIGKLDHTANLRLGGCWSAGCHAAVHGSQVHPRFLY
ncbi:MAG: hypothetical protein HYR88_01760 [Verrucomicrobia bacterium]|nr:hypothetical protein [Verrucomicrobiota bacterium]